MNITKYITKLVCGVALFVGLTAEANTVSITLTNTQFTNVPGLVGPVLVKQIIVANTNAGTNQTVYFYNVGTNQLITTNLAYTNTSTYLTNATNSFTNYNGFTNLYTNIIIMDNTNNAVAAVINTNSPTIVLQAPANSTTKTDGNLFYHFYNGLWISNSAPSNSIITITFQ